jgi:copper chaperone CopZ
MKNKTILSALATLLLGAMAFIMPPNKATVTFKVFGNCGMCKNRIEAALDKPGITKAVWNIESKMLTVTFNTKKYEEIQLHNLVAAVGHDTEKVKASDKAYADLPECCLYRSDNP